VGPRRRRLALAPARLAADRRRIELADVEQLLLDTDELPAVERERLIAAVRTLADVYVRLTP
jgi:hypothetical protein